MPDIEIEGWLTSLELPVADTVALYHAHGTHEQLHNYLDLRELIRQAAGESLDLKAFEADMRHLIDTYIEASAPRKISPFDDIGLLELIVNSGIAAAIADKLGQLKGHQDAIAESIENNVRNKTVCSVSPIWPKTCRPARPAIRRSRSIRRDASRCTTTSGGVAGDMTPQVAAPYGEDDPALALILRIGKAVKDARPEGWRGITARELLVKQALYEVLTNVAEVERIFVIVFAHIEY